jgi:type I restriction enzyme R subunit
MKSIMQWVRLHPYNIASKVQIVVEHYRENVQPLLAGRAKARVVVGSRREAVRWQKAVRTYIASKNYPLDVLVPRLKEFEGLMRSLASLPPLDE